MNLGNSRTWLSGALFLLVACNPDVHVTVVVQGSGGTVPMDVAGGPATRVVTGSGAAGRAPLVATMALAGGPNADSYLGGAAGATIAAAGTVTTTANTSAGTGAEYARAGASGASNLPSNGGGSIPNPTYGGSPVTLASVGGSPIGVAQGGSTAGGKATNASGGAPLTSAGGFAGKASSSGGAIAVRGGATGVGGAATAGSSTLPIGAGGSADPASCSAAFDFMALAMQSPDYNRIGPNPCGLQGLISAYSDDGIDKSPNTGDESVKEPVYDPKAANPRTWLSPCSSNGVCCIRGTTSLWPKTDGKTDYNAGVWGGGLSVELNALADQKSPYSGPMKGVMLTMSIEAPMDVRIQLQQSVDDPYPPFATYKKFVEKNYPIYFNDPAATTKIACPTAAAWGKDNAYVRGCVAPTDHPYELRVEVVGGDAAGDFSLCIESIKPIL